MFVAKVTGSVVATQKVDTMVGYKLLVVVSEGTDADPASAQVELPKLKQRAAAHGIEVRSLVYKAELDRPAADVIQWFCESRREMSADGLGTDLALALGRLGP